MLEKTGVSLDFHLHFRLDYTKKTRPSLDISKFIISIHPYSKLKIILQQGKKNHISKHLKSE